MSGFDIDKLGGDAFRKLDELRSQNLEKTKLIGEGLIGDEVTGKDLEGEGFSNHLADALEKISSLKTDVKDKAEAVARGENVELHDLMISMGKSDVAFNLMLEVRNKLLEAWNTLSRSAV